LYIFLSNNLPVSCNRQAAGSNSCTFPNLTIYLLIVTDKLQGVILVHFLSNNLPVSCNRQAAESNSCTFPTLNNLPVSCNRQAAGSNSCTFSI
jgi:hypothetical protein